MINLLLLQDENQDKDAGKSTYTLPFVELCYHFSFFSSTCKLLQYTVVDILIEVH